MSRLILTDKKLVRLKNAKPKTRCDVLDALMPNLSVRVTDTGSKAFIFRIRYPGKLFPSRRKKPRVMLAMQRARLQKKIRRRGY